MALQSRFTQPQFTKVNWLGREKMVEILERHGFAVYDHEPTEDLKEALVQEIEAGGIDFSELDE